MTDKCGPVPVDEHNVNDPSCDYAPAPEPAGRVKCEFCPIELEVWHYIKMIGDGWDGEHTFQLPFVNWGRVVPCRGRFRRLDHTKNPDMYVPHVEHEYLTPGACTCGWTAPSRPKPGGETPATLRTSEREHTLHVRGGGDE